MALLEVFNLFRAPKTLRYDDAQGLSPEARGVPMPVLRADVDCSACRACETVCPTQTIQVELAAALIFDYGRCTQCGLCVDACPEKLIENTRLVDVFATDRARLVVKFHASVEPSLAPEAEASTELIAFRALSSRNGFNYREVAATGNNAVECELGASFNNVFDSESFGVRSVASPKHADAVVYSGPVAPGMAGPLNDAWNCMPGPKALISCGTEAVSGGSFDLGPLPARPLLFIGGDPPRPDVICRAFLYLMGHLKLDFGHKVLRSYRELVTRRKNA